MKQRFRTAYDFGETQKYGFVNADPETGEVYESMTAQEFAPFCDVNRIIARWEKTGVLEHTARFQGQYGVFVGPESYHAAMNRIMDVQSMFNTLPARMREEFGNDPGAFLRYVGDPENYEEMAKRGLIPNPLLAEGSEPASDNAAEPRNDGAKAKSPAPADEDAES